MNTHSMIFVTIDKLVSPSSSVNGDPLDDFPDHWQPRFSAQLPFPGQVKGRTGLPPPNERISPVSVARESQAGSVGSVVSSCHLRDTLFLHELNVI